MSRTLLVPLLWGFVAAATFPGQRPARSTRARARAAEPAPITIPYQRFVLKNGLTLLVHEDHKAPIVAVNIWYHVGSKNERPGRTGFAHLFEHLMFNGSEHFNDDFFQPFERIGATDQNGTKNEDRTNYFENVPTNALDIALWMESDRMGHLLGAIDTAKVNEQRGVVQNEKRQGENQPYGKVDNLMTEGTYPAGHPYSWTVIGSMEDLNAASVEDVKQWFRTYYGPDRKSTRLNSSHGYISYAVFCLKKKDSWVSASKMVLPSAARRALCVSCGVICSSVSIVRSRACPSVSSSSARVRLALASILMSQ